MKGRIKNKNPDRKPDNLAAVQALIDCGFSLKNIRLALPKLTNTTHAQIAKKASRPRNVITLTISGDYSKDADMTAIAEFWGVPKEILYRDKIGGEQ